MHRAHQKNQENNAGRMNPTPTLKEIICIKVFWILKYGFLFFVILLNTIHYSLNTIY